MRLTLEEKKTLVAEVAKVAAKAPAGIAAEYLGISANNMNALRRTAREKEIYLRVIPNTLARRALSGTPFECMRGELKGPLLLGFSQNEPSAVAKVMRDFSKKDDKLIVKLVSLEGQLLGSNGVQMLAQIPSLDEARSRLLGLFKMPLGKLARLLTEPGNTLARLLAARRDQAQ